MDNANGFPNTYPLDSDGAIQCLNNRDLESKSACLYLQFIRAIFYDGFKTSWHHKNVLSCGSLYLGFMPYHEMRNSITVYLLDFQQYTKRQTNPHCGSQSTVFRNLLFTSILNHRTKCSTSKKRSNEKMQWSDNERKRENLLHESTG